MAIPEVINRRKFLMAAVTCSSLAGCSGTQGDQQGVIDASDISILSSGPSELTAKNVQKDGNKGLKISTKNSVTDGKVVAEIPTSISRASKSTVYISIDVDELDDDTEAEIGFQSAESGHRSIYIGNEYKTKNKGVLATKTGSGFELRKPFQKLPGSKKAQSGPSQRLNRIQFVIRDGDFKGTVWDLGFIFEDRTIVIL